MDRLLRDKTRPPGTAPVPAAVDRLAHPFAADRRWDNHAVCVALPARV